MFLHFFWVCSFHSSTGHTSSFISRIWVEIDMLWLFRIFGSDALIWAFMTVHQRIQIQLYSSAGTSYRFFIPAGVPQHYLLSPRDSRGFRRIPVITIPVQVSKLWTYLCTVDGTGAHSATDTAEEVDQSGLTTFAAPVLSRSWLAVVTTAGAHITVDITKTSPSSA